MPSSRLGRLQQLQVFPVQERVHSLMKFCIRRWRKSFIKRKRSPAYHKEIKGLDHLDKVIDIDQAPIGRTPRSNPATYTGVFDDIRDVFAQTNEAKVRGYKKAVSAST